MKMAKRWMPIGLVLVGLAAAGCAHTGNRAGRYVLPPDRRPASPPPAAAVAVETAPAATNAPAPTVTAPPKPASSWWSQHRERQKVEREARKVKQEARKAEQEARRAAEAQKKAPEAGQEKRPGWFGSREKTSPAAAPAPSSGSAAEAAPAPVSTVAVYKIRVGDPLVIYLRNVPGYPGGQQNVEAVVDENGTINLPFLNFVQVAGKSPAEVERELQSLYVDGGFYRNIGINVLLPTRVFYVYGEVRAPGRFQLVGNVTVLQAIASAGGFTDYANARAVEVKRLDKVFRVNVKDLKKNPVKDIELEAGDVVNVPRSPF